MVHSIAVDEWFERKCIMANDLFENDISHPSRGHFSVSGNFHLTVWNCVDFPNVIYSSNSSSVLSTSSLTCQFGEIKWKVLAMPINRYTKQSKYAIVTIALLFSKNGRNFHRVIRLKDWINKSTESKIYFCSWSQMNFR